MSRALQMHADDNVAMALQDLQAGERVRVSGPAGQTEVLLREAVPLCHKFALSDIAAQAAVRKYGQTIGVARQAIAAGSHVHVHNLGSLRAQRRPGP